MFIFHLNLSFLDNCAQQVSSRKPSAAKKKKKIEESKSSLQSSSARMEGFSDRCSDDGGMEGREER